MLKHHHIKQKIAIIAFLAIFIAILASCTKDFQKINTPHIGSETATINQLYTGIGSQLDNTAEGEDATSTRWLYPITQQGAVYARSDYDFGQGANWNGLYSNMAATYQILKQITALKADSANYTNVKAMLLTLRAYQAIELSNFYGSIPYSKAAKGFSGSAADFSPAYDTQQAVYLSCLKDLTWAVNNFSTGSNQYSFGSFEFLLGNQVPQWVKFANSLRLRYALTMYDKDSADAGPIIADALNKPLLTDAVADVVGLSQTYVPNISFDIGGGGRGWSFRQESRIRMGTTMWNLMSSSNDPIGSGIFDPRCKIFFEANGDTTGNHGQGRWVPYPQDPPSPITDGGNPYDTQRDPADSGWTSRKSGNNYSDFNYYWGRDGNIAGSSGAVPEIFMTASEVHFLKAEVYARGIAGLAQNMGTAQTEYEAGVTSSITYWTSAASNSSIWIVGKPAAATPSAADINAVLTNPKVAFNASNAVQLIYAQEWIDLIRQPWVAWTLQRRTGGTTPADTDNPSVYAQNYGTYQRYQYPSDEPLLNTANWRAATNGGTDLATTKIWITK
ncbi:MAG: SusD/RagB family nutrient-binding outer membrane lipoprotein [Sphingobacteriales bacterium]